MITSAGEGKVTIMLAQEEKSSSGKEDEAKSQDLECELDKESTLEEGVDEALELPIEQDTNDQKAEEVEGNKKEGKSWRDLFKNNREGGSGLKLKKVIEDGDEVVITREDVEPEVRFWQFSLIAYIVGQNIPVNVMVNFLKFRWKGIVIPHVIKHEEGYFILRFENREDMECALAKGIQYFYSKPMILRKWIEGVPKPEEMRVIPVWIQLPKLPLGFWGGSTLSKIVSKIGEPIKTDELTAKKLKIEYARVLVNIELGKELPEKIKIKSEVDGCSFNQDVKYEWMPVICKRCRQWGHKEEKCSKPGIMQWQVKKKGVAGEEKDKQEHRREEVPIPDQGGTVVENRSGKRKEQGPLMGRDTGKDKITYEKGTAEEIMNVLLQRMSKEKSVEIGEPSRPPNL